MAIERDLVCAGAINSHPAPQPMVRLVRERSEDSQKPAWMDKLTKLVRAVSMQTTLLLAAHADYSLATLASSSMSLGPFPFPDQLPQTGEGM
ncbi:unnamed protein product [Gadus morhua 'NCC']